MKDPGNCSKEEGKIVRAEVLEPSEANLKICGERIANGKLVSFPTETVYGLGADATNSKAVASIFEAKERPLTDPVIVHIADMSLVEKCFEGKEVIEFVKDVGSKLWPGPLTLIGPINDKFIPPMVGSNTGSIGVRFPSNKTAQALIKAAGTPIAAPSANKFMHVSPTSYEHVFDDLKYEDIFILKGESCQLGVESTVVRVEFQGTSTETETTETTKTHRKFLVTLLRSGTCSLDLVKSVILEQYPKTEIVTRKELVKSEEKANIAPGQLLKHYSPFIDCFLLSKAKANFEANSDKVKALEEVHWENLGVIDFNKQHEELKSKVKHYLDLSPEGDYDQAMHDLYKALRDAESFSLSHLLIVNLKDSLTPEEYAINTLADKTFRSAAGKTLTYNAEYKLFENKE